MSLNIGAGGGLSWKRSIYLSLHRTQTELNWPITQQVQGTHSEMYNEIRHKQQTTHTTLIISMWFTIVIIICFRE